MKTSQLKTAINSAIFVWLLSCLIFGCDPKKPAEIKPPLVESKKDLKDVKISITKINDNLIVKGKKPTVEQFVDLEGTISDPDLFIYALVNPTISNIWWVQNPPKPFSKIDSQIWKWTSKVRCGDIKLGLNEDFDIIALADQKANRWQPGEQIKTEDIPKDLPKSEIIEVYRGK